MVFIGLMPATAAAFKRLCSDSHRCLTSASLAPAAACLGSCLLLWLARTGAEVIQQRRRANEEAKPLVANDGDGDGPADAGAACCSDATPSALQDPTTAALITAALLLKAIVEGLAVPNMLTVASPLFVALAKCLHEACCGLVVGLAWSDSISGGGGDGGGSSSSVRRWGIFALLAYAVAASGSLLLGGLTASVHSVAGTAVQFALLVAASGAGLQAAFVHILPRLPAGPASPALALLGALLMALVASAHHAFGGGEH
ncbi:hypothetical protein BOX15_Mlig015603g1 [Macrostomum lignano]|nr:hypothetical protein BOX15_Mlig015603g1 [Macrostomum lignano]